VLIVNTNLCFFSHYVGIDGTEVRANSSFKILISDGNLEVMVEFSSVNLNTRLICFECDTISYSCSKHHLRALHKVVHAIFKLWHKSLFIDKVEVDSLISNHLDPNIASNEINLSSSLWQNVVPLP
jgi:hypothetical protein